MQANTLSLVLLLVGTTGALADDMKMPVNASQLEWAPAPNFVPEGAQIAVLSGDPSKDGLYVIRLKMPAGYKIPAHNHPTTEMVTVIPAISSLEWATSSMKALGLEMPSTLLLRADEVIE